MNLQASCWLALLTWMAMAWTEAIAGGGTAKIDAKLIYGSNEEGQPKEVALSDLESRFKPDFGYKHYKLLGEKSTELKEGDNAMLDLGQKFQVELKHAGTKQKVYILQVNLYHQGKWLFYFDARVPQKSEPIFIKGPWTEHGLVIIALTAK